MPKRNYNQAKRQREASREEKKAQKLQRKLDRVNTTPPDPDTDESTPPDSPQGR
ncbi:MAG TPA: hypothetical protein VEB59_07040 [Gemmatimonadales bacterium]|nr:hypothetical protein [Gemmatimonadales bacterium]